MFIEIKRVHAYELYEFSSKTSQSSIMAFILKVLHNVSLLIGITQINRTENP